MSEIAEAKEKAERRLAQGALRHDLEWCDAISWGEVKQLSNAVVALCDALEAMRQLYDATVRLESVGRPSIEDLDRVDFEELTEFWRKFDEAREALGGEA